jgi:hypothetical protein
MHGLAVVSETVGVGVPALRVTSVAVREHEEHCDE